MKQPKKTETPAEKQLRASRAIGYGAIHFERQGNRAIVQIEANGQWLTIFEEHIEPTNTWSDTLYPTGLYQLIRKKELPE